MAITELKLTAWQDYQDGASPYAWDNEDRDAVSLLHLLQGLRAFGEQ